jgi:hypothetical protein
MVKVKCQHSGIEFEAKTSRTKQHPFITKLKQDGAMNGDYREVNQCLANVTMAGGYDTIEEYMALVLADLKAQEEISREYAKRELARYEAHLQKTEEQNSILKANGYFWRFKMVDQGRRKLFYLNSPDGRILSVEDALNEIEHRVKLEE